MIFDMKTVLGKVTNIAGLLVLIAGISGCADLQKRIGSFLGDTKETTVQTNARDEAAHKYNYQGTRDELFVEAPSLSASVVKSGDTLTQTLQFSLLSPDANKGFLVQEVVTLAGQDILLELSRNSSNKVQGMHSSTIQFTIPKDLPRGDYELVTTITGNGLKKKLKASFKAR